MPSGRRTPHAAGSELSSADSHGSREEDTQKVMDSVQRLFAIFSVVNKPVYQRDLLHLEGVMGPELDQETHIQNLTTAMLVTSQAKDEKIKKLTKENERMKMDHQEFEKEKTAFQVEKKEFENKHHEMEDDHVKKDQKREKDYKRRELELVEECKQKYLAAKNNFDKGVEEAKDAAEKKVQTEVQELKSRVKELETALAKQASDSESEIERFKALEKVHKDKIKTLDSELQVVDPSRKMSKKPSTYYLGIFEKISDSIAKIADDYFNTPLEDIDFTRLLGQQHDLSEVSKIFNYASSSGADVATSLRKSAIRHFIASKVTEVLENSLFALMALNSNQTGNDLQAFYGSSNLSNHEKVVWRTITLKAVDKAPQLAKLAKDISATVTKKMDCLVEKKNKSKVSRELASLFKAALEVRNTMNRDSREWTINMSPPRKNDMTWKIIEMPPAPTNGNNDTVAAAAARGSAAKPESFAIFPQIIGKFEEDNEGMKQEILHQGIGLFSDSPMFDLGVAEFEELKRELVRTHKRHSSISSPTTPGRLPLSVNTGTVGRTNGSA